jgi:predicted RNA binding protein YcfA (HicA-like mRNA interferase family)
MSLQIGKKLYPVELTGRRSSIQGHLMGKYEKLEIAILEGRADASIRFNELRQLLLRLGFVERIRGSHHLLRHPDLGVRINLQPAGKMAKPYQVRQVRAVIMSLRLRDEES